MEFGEWHPLSKDGIAMAPEAAASVQLRRAEGLIDYPKGKSAMVFYFFAPESARTALSRHFDDEIAEPGIRGEGPLWFRIGGEGEGADAIGALFAQFVERFGGPPKLHEDLVPAEGDDDV